MDSPATSNKHFMNNSSPLMLPESKKQRQGSLTDENAPTNNPPYPVQPGLYLPMATSTPSHGNIPPPPGAYYHQTAAGYPPVPIPSPQTYNVNLSPENVKEIAVAVRDILLKDISEIIHKETAPLRAELDAIKLENQDLRLKLDDLEQYSRRPLVRISGIPESPSENTTTQVLDAIEKAGISVSAEDIERSHRVGNPVKSRGKPRQIIMRLRTYEAKRSLLKHSKKFRDCSATKAISVNEDLTKYRDRLAFICRQLAKNPQSSVVQTWTWDGKVMVKDRSERTHQIFQEKDLCRFGHAMSSNSNEPRPLPSDQLTKI